MGEPGPFHSFPVLGARLPAYLPQVDLLKAFAILSVIAIHTLPTGTLLLLGAPFWLWQAVPLFILVAGFTGAYGLRKRDAVTLKQCYEPSVLARRYLRLFVPFALFWILEALYLASHGMIPLDAWSLAMNFLSGGSGWGAYFIPVILQSVLFVPLLYYVGRRDADLLVIAALWVSVGFLAIVIWTGSAAVSSLLYFRYIFAGALGVWLVTAAKPRRAAVLASVATGFLFLVLTSYTDLVSPGSVFYRYDGVLQFPSFGWTLGVAMAGLVLLPRAVTSRPVRALSGIGKASWHIFLFQMFYFLLPGQVVNDFFISLWTRTYGLVPEPPLLGFILVPETTLALVILSLNTLICVACGYGWYRAEGEAVRLIRGPSPRAG